MEPTFEGQVSGFQQRWELDAGKRFSSGTSGSSEPMRVFRCLASLSRCAEALRGRHQ